MTVIVNGTRTRSHPTPSGTRLIAWMESIMPTGIIAVMPTGVISMEIGIVPGIVPHVAVVVTCISPIASPMVPPTIIPVATPSVGITHHVV